MRVKIIKCSVLDPYEPWWYNKIGEIIKVKKKPFIDSAGIDSLNLKNDKHFLNSAYYGYKDWVGGKKYIYLNDTNYKIKIRKQKLQKINKINDSKM